MTVTALNSGQVKEMLTQVAQKMVGKKDDLTKADQVIGDGDHGIGMARGFEAVEKKLAQSDFDSAAKTLGAVGMALMTSVGGASGAIFGTLFRSGSKEMSPEGEFDTAALATVLNSGLAAIKTRGGAKAGDKTMIDALEPAAEAAKAQAESGASLDKALDKVAQAAEQGMENSKNMIASMGRAKTLGERCLGHPDPGAVSMAYILRFMCEYVNEN